MDTNSQHISSPPTPLEQPSAPKRAPSKKMSFLIILLLIIIIASSIIIAQTMPKGAVREVQRVYKSLGGSDEFATMRTQVVSGVRISTSLLFEHSLFSPPSEISVLGTLSTSGLIIMAGIDMKGDVYTWRIEAMYDGETYGRGVKTGMQSVTYSGKISPAFFDADSTLTITEKENSDYVPSDFKSFLLKYGAQLMAQALDDLNAVMNGYGVYDLGFKQFK